MTYAVDRTTSPALQVVPNAIASFRQLSADEQLGLLWVIYENMGGAITPAAPGAARMQFAEGLLQDVKAMPQQDQLQFMRDLVNRINTEHTRAYGVLSNNTKLAFWYQLAELMRTGEVIPVPSFYKLPEQALALFGQISKLEFGQQITVLRQAVMEMGVDPLAA
ncbi:Orange carotenoid-binding protein [Halomicronema hongdechloris C2206]|uniref:Orange carotenoid-binding protein n=1 Tax=Halomicronema hongdechloris C2206 TaxID=1641165 RepID=A0A1Z3HM33_9CYAN|nr:orange carotenoid protein N-terminal domain-containing protein [Halomicronema hongdechloris]ASC71350.1 Orange carotenoid-binding protein [Halomicronema hongdechloris C2206]